MHMRVQRRRSTSVSSRRGSVSASARAARESVSTSTSAYTSAYVCTAMAIGNQWRGQATGYPRERVRSGEGVLQGQMQLQEQEPVCTYVCMHMHMHMRVHVRVQQWRSASEPSRRGPARAARVWQGITKGECECVCKCKCSNGSKRWGVCMVMAVGVG